MAGVKGRSGSIGKPASYERDAHRLWRLSVNVLNAQLISPHVADKDKRYIAVELVKKFGYAFAPVIDPNATPQVHVTLIQQLHAMAAAPASLASVATSPGTSPGCPGNGANGDAGTHDQPSSGNRLRVVD